MYELAAAQWVMATGKAKPSATEYLQCEAREGSVSNRAQHKLSSTEDKSLRSTCDDSGGSGNSGSNAAVDCGEKWKSKGRDNAPPPNSAGGPFTSVTVPMVAASRYRLPTTYYLLPTYYFLLPITYYLLPAAHYLLRTTYYPASTAYYYLLPATYCVLCTVYCLLPTAHCLLPTAYCLLLTACCLLPTAYYLLST
jgi:hypothetical protein